MGVRGWSLHRDDPPPTVATRCTKWGSLFGVGKRHPVLNGGFRRAGYYRLQTISADLSVQCFVCSLQCRVELHACKSFASC